MKKVPNKKLPLKKEAVKKPIIHLLIEDHKSTPIKAYVDFFAKTHEPKVVLFSDIDISSTRRGKYKKLPFFDLVVFTDGQTHVAPVNYTESVGKYTILDEERDHMCSKIFDMFYGVEKLGFGRGAHFLAVKGGASLIQYVNNFKEEVQVLKHGKGINRKGFINFYRKVKQLIFTQGLPSSSYRIILSTAYYTSTTYLNGRDEEIDLPLDFIEIVGAKFTNIKATVLDFPFNSIHSIFNSFKDITAL